MEALQLLTDGGEQDWGQHDWGQQERPLGSWQSHSWPSLKHCSNIETSGQQSLHWAEQRSWGWGNNTDTTQQLLQNISSGSNFRGNTFTDVILKK